VIESQCFFESNTGPTLSIIDASIHLPVIAKVNLTRKRLDDVTMRRESLRCDSKQRTTYVKAETALKSISKSFDKALCLITSHNKEFADLAAKELINLDNERALYQKGAQQRIHGGDFQSEIL